MQAGRQAKQDRQQGTGLVPISTSGDLPDDLSLLRK